LDACSSENDVDELKMIRWGSSRHTAACKRPYPLIRSEV